MIRLLKNSKEDLQGIISIIKENYPQNPQYLEAVLADVELSFSSVADKYITPVFYVLEVAGDFVGFGAIKSSFGDINMTEAFWFNIRAKDQGKGYGRVLFQTLIDMVKKEGIEFIIMTCEKKNRALYEKIGFTVTFQNKEGNCFMHMVAQ